MVQKYIKLSLKRQLIPILGLMGIYNILERITVRKRVGECNEEIIVHKYVS